MTEIIYASKCSADNMVEESRRRKFKHSTFILRLLSFIFYLSKVWINLIEIEFSLIDGHHYI
jgi:hypothetical protein